MTYLDEELATLVKQRFSIDCNNEESLKESISKLISEQRLSVDDYAAMTEQARKAGRARYRSALTSLLTDDDDGQPAEQETMAEMNEKLRQKLVKQGIFKDETPMNQGSELQRMFADTGGGDGVRVKAVGERYRNDRHVLKHKSWGTPIHPIRSGSISPAPIESLTEWETAKLGAFIKFRAVRAGFGSLTEHDKQVLDASFCEDTYIGWSGDQLVRTMNTKALIDDATSGGQYLSPEFFDRRIVSFPLLHSELLPFVDVVDVPRGSSVETVSVGNPTLVWNTTEGSAQALFNTAGLVETITATMHPVAVYLTVGVDMLSDSLPNIGGQISTNVSQRIAAELDEVIASGDGSTQPQGIDAASGTVDVTPSNPTTGAITVNDLLDLMFGVAKQYRTPSNNPRFVMTDARYKSHRALATGLTGDDRLLHGMSVQSYTLLESPVAIENSGIGNNHGIFGALMKYRLWRREGFDFGWERGGDTLVRSNLALFHARGRYGGKVIDANAFAVCDAWPSTA